MSMAEAKPIWNAGLNAAGAVPALRYLPLRD